MVPMNISYDSYMVINNDLERMDLLFCFDQLLGNNLGVRLGELLGSLLLLVLLGEEVVDVGHDDGNSWCEAGEKELRLSCKAILQHPLLPICKTKHSK